jgi:hypothetical protein
MPSGTTASEFLMAPDVSTRANLVRFVHRAENVLTAWKNLTAQSTALYNSLPSSAKPAFFQLVHHPATAAATLAEMWIASGINALRATQARASANTYADRVETLFEQDYEIETEYHSLLDGKWDHFMDQTHVGYAYWQQPMVNSMPSITRVQAKKQSLAGALRIVPEGYRGAWVTYHITSFPNFDPDMHPTFSFTSAWRQSLSVRARVQLPRTLALDRSVPSAGNQVHRCWLRWSAGLHFHGGLERILAYAGTNERKYHTDSTRAAR